jgi:hypothetical protein
LPYARGLLLLLAGTTPQHSGGDAHSAANTQPKAKKRKPDGGSSTESARESTKSPRPIHGSISESFRPGDLQNGGPHARHALQPTTMGAARDAEQEQRVLGPNSVNMLPSLEQEICMRALTEVIRSRSLNAKDKVKQLGVMCLRPEGSLLRSCLDGNGWSSKRNRTEGYPSWPEAVHRLTLALHALANNEPVQVAEQVAAPPHSALALQGTDPARARAPGPYLCSRSVAVAAAI